MRATFWEAGPDIAVAHTKVRFIFARLKATRRLKGGVYVHLLM